VRAGDRSKREIQTVSESGGGRNICAWSQDCGESVAALVRLRIGEQRTAKQGLPDNRHRPGRISTAYDVAAVSPGIRHAHSISVLSDVQPAVRANFELGFFPGSVRGGGTCDVPELCFRSRLKCIDPEGKRKFEDLLAFVPVDIGGDSDVAAALFEGE